MSFAQIHASSKYVLVGTTVAITNMILMYIRVLMSDYYYWQPEKSSVASLNGPSALAFLVSL